MPVSFLLFPSLWLRLTLGVGSSHYHHCTSLTSWGYSDRRSPLATKTASVIHSSRLKACSNRRLSHRLALLSWCVRDGYGWNSGTAPGQGTCSVRSKDSTRPWVNSDAHRRLRPENFGGDWLLRCPITFHRCVATARASGKRPGHCYQKTDLVMQLASSLDRFGTSLNLLLTQGCT